MSKNNSNSNTTENNIMLDLSKLSAADLLRLAAEKQIAERETAFVNIDKTLANIPGASRNVKIIVAALMNDSITAGDIAEHFRMHGKSGEADTNNVNYCLKPIRDLQAAGFKITIEAPEAEAEAEAPEA